jgi:hypothetical protein
MSRFSFRDKKFAFLLASGLLPVLVLGVWLGRTPLLAWYQVRSLAHAGETDRTRLAQRVVDLDQAAVPRLFRYLTQNDHRVCENVHSALDGLHRRWGWEDSRATDLAIELTRAFPRFSLAGQEMVLRLKTRWLAPDDTTAATPEPVLEADAHLVEESVRLPGKGVRVAALELTAALACQSSELGLVQRWREVARTGLRDSDPEVRVRAIQLAQTPQFDLLDRVVQLLRDPAAQVRRAAILAVGPSQSAVSSEELLSWLHDPDPDVRRLCEVALRGRNVSEDNLRLGRLITDPRHDARLQAIEELLADPDREPGAWLRRLSHDPTPSVRAAAIRAAALRPRSDLADRLQEMTQSDPSPTICQLAQFYLSSQKQSGNRWSGN